MKRIHKSATLILFLFVFFKGNAQTDSLSSKPQLKLSANYNTRLNYYGRTDSFKSSGFFPLTELWLTPKFYVNAAPIFVNNKSKQFDYAGTVATIGYQTISSKWISSIYATKPFYKQRSELVQSALKAQGGVSLTYQNKIANLTAGGDAKLSDKMDYGASAGVDHVIRMEGKNKSVLVVDPAIYVHAGTQNFQRTYFKKNNAASLLFPQTNKQVTEEVSRFALLACEVSMPLIYSKGKTMLIATPSFIMPQNLITVFGGSNAPERGENMFYATLTAKYSF